MDVKDRLIIAREAAGFDSARSAAFAHGWNDSTYRAHENGQNGISVKMATKYAAAFNVSLEWLLNGGESPIVRDYGHSTTGQVIELHPAREPVVRPASNISAPFVIPQAGRTMMPVYGNAAGSLSWEQEDEGKFVFNGEPMAWVPVPPQLSEVRDPYGVYVVGSSMEPRYFQGDCLYVNPIKPPKNGDFVVVQMHPDEDGKAPVAFVKRLVKTTSTQVFLEQYHPEPKVFPIPRDSVRTIHKVVGMGEI